MHTIFRWFYCLPVAESILLLILATEIYLFLLGIFENSRYWKRGICFLLFCWMAMVFFVTLGLRAEGENQAEPILIPFYSYYTVFIGGNKELFRSNFMNAALFYPAGLLACGGLPAHWSKIRNIILISCLFAIVSIGIEYAQYHFGMGLAETDDVIHNTLGALTGTLVCCTFKKLNQPN